MRKIITIAIREYWAMVGTKAFLVSIIMMPILMLGGIFAMELMQNVEQTKERTIAVIDHSNQFYDLLTERAAIHKAMLQKQAEMKASGKSAEEPSDDISVPGMAPEIYHLEKIDPQSASEELRFELSERIRNQELYAFVEIPADVLKTGLTDDNDIKFYSQDSSLSLARNWLGSVVSRLAKEKRIAESGIAKSDVRKIRKASSPVTVKGFGLFTKSNNGSIKTESEQNPITSLFLPMGIMMLMFMVIFMAAQPMLESVIEEKSQRIAEVLLGSANPFQLMLGKLLGTVAGSLTVFAIYAIGAFLLASNRGWMDLVPFEIMPWFLAFQIVGVLLYASIFMAVGASVSQLKEAQSMLLPVWMLMMSPLFIWFFIVRDPLGPLATGFSFFPPATPTTMVLRMATGQSIPVWQPILGLVLTLLTTLLIVFLAARIFRVGILWQGKTPKLSEIFRWATTGQ